MVEQSLLYDIVVETRVDKELNTSLQVRCRYCGDKRLVGDVGRSPFVGELVTKATVLSVTCDCDL